MNRVQAKLAGFSLLLAAVALMARPASKVAETPTSRIDRSETAHSQSRASGKSSSGAGRFSNRAHDPQPGQTTAGREAAVSLTEPFPLQTGPGARLLESRAPSDARITRPSATGGHSSGVRTDAPDAAPTGSPALSSSDTLASGQDIGQSREHSPGQPPFAFPAVLVEIDLPSLSSPEAADRLVEVAGEFADALDRSGLDPAAQEYRHVWNREKSIADARFRAMYGGHAWMAHHVQAHHLLNSPPGQ
jgi:hypothetical protein